MGGKTPEYEISLISGREVVKNLAREKYEAIPIMISREGKEWRIVEKESFLKKASKFEAQRPEKEWSFEGSRVLKGVNELVDIGDVVFIAMHGPFGEDGTVQGMLDLFGIPYTGPGVLASALGMDKLMFRKIMELEKIPVPKYVALKSKMNGREIKRKLGPFPYFVKPNSQGSSVGCSLVKNEGELIKALDLAFSYDEIVLVDEYLGDKELTCAILGNEKPRALPVIEILPAGEFFDYESKYESGGAEEIVPARIKEEVKKEVQKLSVKVYEVLGCKGFSRVDFMLKGGEKPVVLEINTIPGLTPMSLLPKAAKADGISYPGLLDEIVRLALEKKKD